MSYAGYRGSLSELWRELSWRVGDQHADRICKLIDLYCWIVSLNPIRFHQKVPR